MKNDYDINVDYKVLSEFQSRLKDINKSLFNINDSMTSIIENANEYLEGNRYRTIRNTTKNCTKKNEEIIEQINTTIKFLEKIEHYIDEYYKCSYKS